MTCLCILVEKLSFIWGELPGNLISVYTTEPPPSTFLPCKILWPSSHRNSNENVVSAGSWEARASVVRGTVTEGLETSMGTKMPSSLQNRKMFFWERRQSNETQHWPPSALRSREGTSSDGSRRTNPGVAFSLFLLVKALPASYLWVGVNFSGPACTLQ